MHRGTLVTVVLLLLAGACAPSSAGPPQPAPASGAPVAGAPAAAPSNLPAPPARVRVGIQNISLDLPIYLGLERGYYLQEGLDVDVVSFANASEMIPALATDQLEMAGISTNPALWNSVARGIP